MVAPPPLVIALIGGALVRAFSSLLGLVLADAPVEGRQLLGLGCGQLDDGNRHGVVEAQSQRPPRLLQLDRARPRHPAHVKRTTSAIAAHAGA